MKKPSLLRQQALGDVWTAVGSLKNPYPDWTDNPEDIQRRKGFKAAKRAIRIMIWNMIRKVAYATKQ